MYLKIKQEVIIRAPSNHYFFRPPAKPIQRSNSSRQNSSTRASSVESLESSTEQLGPIDEPYYDSVAVDDLAQSKTPLTFPKSLHSYRVWGIYLQVKRSLVPKTSSPLPAHFPCPPNATPAPTQFQNRSRRGPPPITSTSSISSSKQRQRGVFMTKFVCFEAGNGQVRMGTAVVMRTKCLSYEEVLTRVRMPVPALWSRLLRRHGENSAR